MFIIVTESKVGSSMRTFITGVVDTYSATPKFLHVGDLVTVPKYYNILQMFDKAQIGYEAKDEIVLPVVVGFDKDDPRFEFDELLYMDDEYNVRSLADMIIYEEDLSSIDEFLSEAIGSAYSASDFRAMCLGSADTLTMIEEYRFRYNLNQKADSNIKAIADKYNSESSVTGIAVTKANTSNVTLPMDSSESELFIQIPKPYYAPGMNSISVNGDDDDNYSAVGDTILVDTIEIESVYQALNPYNGEVRASHPLAFKQVMDSIGVANIMGDTANNDIPIQHNEMRFYRSLNKFIERNVKLYLEAEGIYTDEEYTRILSENDLPMFIRISLESFVKAMVNVNWSHSANVPVNEFTPEASGDDDDSSSDGGGDSQRLSGDYLVSDDIASIDSKDPGLTHYMTSLESLMKSEVSAYAWSEMIIKLARWGSRKPTHLKFTEDLSGNCTSMVNLYRFQIEEDLAYLKEYTPHVVEGCSFFPSALVVNDNQNIADFSGFIDGTDVETYGDSTICTAGVLGLRCNQMFVTPRGKKIVSVYFSLDTIVDNYSRGVDPILGLELVDDKFVLNPEATKNLGNSMYVSNVTSLVASRADRNKVKMSHKAFSCLQEFKNFNTSNSLKYGLFGFVSDIMTTADLREYLNSEDCKVDAVRYYEAKTFEANMQYMFLPTKEKETLDDALNIYKELYSDVDFSNSEVTSAEAEGEMGMSDLFGTVKIEPMCPLFALSVGTDVFYLCKLHDVDSNGCDRILVHDENMVDIEQPHKKVPGMEAVKYVAIIGYKNRVSNYSEKIACSKDTIDAIDAALKKNIHLDIEGYIRRATAAQKK